MNKEVETELKAKLKQLPMPEKVKCCALYHHLKQVYSAQTECDNKNRKIIFDFQGSFGPLLSQVSAIAHGTELTEADLEGKEDFFTPEELEAKEFMNTEPLDSYYLTVLKKGPAIAEVVQTHDEPILKHLINVESEVFENNDDYKLKFTFSENEFFTNEVLNLHVVVDEEEATAKEIKSDKINWKEGKNVTEKTISKKQKNKRTGQNRTVAKTSKQDSFFLIFKDRMAEDDDEEDEGKDDEGEEGIDSFDMCEDIIELIKDNVVPYAGASFFGVTIPELEIPEAEEDDAEFQDLEDSDCSDEDDDEDAPKKPAKKGKGKKSGDAIPGQPKAEECKQN